MLPSERQRAILREIERNGEVIATDFADRIGVSGMTVRRDLLDLEREGLLTRVHGGAVRRELPSKARPDGGNLTVGLIVPSSTYYFPGFIAGAKAAAARENVRLVLGISNYQAEVEQHQIQRLHEIGVDAIIVTPRESVVDGGEQTYRLLARTGLPVVIMERSLSHVPIELALGGVRSDHAYGAMLAVHHLVGCERTRLGLIAEPRGTTANPVHDGFRTAMAAMLPDSPILEFDVDRSASTVDQLLTYNRILDECESAGVDGLVILPDDVAIAVAEAAGARGLRIPQDVSIVAYDDEIASLAPLPLTAISPPKFDVGAVAVRMCVDLLNPREHAGRLPVQSRIMLPPSLTVRDSSVWG